MENKMNGIIGKNLKRIGYWTLILVLIVLFSRYVINNWEDFAKLRLVNPTYIILIVGLSLIFFWSYGLLMKYLVKPYGIRLKFSEYFGLSIVTGFYNLVAPITGGAISRALYMKKKHNFRYSHFVSLLSGIYIIHYFIGSILGLISLWIVYLIYGIASNILLVVFTLIFIVTFYLVLFSPRLSKTKYSWMNHLIESVNEWHIIRKNKKTVLIVSLITIFQTLINMLGIIATFGIFNIDLGYSKAFLLSTIGFVGGFMSVAPGIVGLSEGVAIFSSFVIGIGVVEMLGIAIVSRVISTAVVLALGPGYSYHLIRRVKKSEKN